MIVTPDPNKRELDNDAVYDVTMAEAERLANGERIVLARLIPRVISAYLTHTQGKEPSECRWTDTDGILRNRDGLIICAAHAGDGARCIREAEHNNLDHIYLDRVITK